MRHINVYAVVIFSVVSRKLDQKIIFRLHRFRNRIEATVASDTYLTSHFQVYLKRILVSYYVHFGIRITSQYHILVKRLEEGIVKLIFKVMTARCKRT